jgi:hypothetical protein
MHESDIHKVNPSFGRVNPVVLYVWHETSRTCLRTQRLVPLVFLFFHRHSTVRLYHYYSVELYSFISFSQSFSFSVDVES